MFITFNDIENRIQNNYKIILFKEFMTELLLILRQEYLTEINNNKKQISFEKNFIHYLSLVVLV